MLKSSMYFSSFCLFYATIASVFWISVAHAFPMEAEAVVNSTGKDCRGEDHSCGNGCSSCNTVELTIPQGYKLRDYRVEVRDDQKGWTADATDLGWCAWEEKKISASDGGGLRIRATLRNWSGDRARKIRIIADVN